LRLRRRAEGRAERCEGSHGAVAGDPASCL